MDSKIIIFGILIVTIAVIGIILYVVKRFLPSPPLPYYKKNIMSEAEKRFFRFLEQTYGDKYYIFCQVNLHSMLGVNKQGKEFWRYANKINQKSVDFVLVNKETCEVLLVIELDDSSHLLPQRVERDLFLDKALKTAGIPLLRVKNAHSYKIDDLHAKLNEDLS